MLPALFETCQCYFETCFLAKFRHPRICMGVNEVTRSLVKNDAQLVFVCDTMRCSLSLFSLSSRKAVGSNICCCKGQSDYATTSFLFLGVTGINMHTFCEPHSLSALVAIPHSYRISLCVLSDDSALKMGRFFGRRHVGAFAIKVSSLRVPFPQKNTMMFLPEQKHQPESRGNGNHVEN